jgi:hypothetical protein
LPLALRVSDINSRIPRRASGCPAYLKAASDLRKEFRNGNVQHSIMHGHLALLTKRVIGATRLSS